MDFDCLCDYVEIHDQTKHHQCMGSFRMILTQNIIMLFDLEDEELDTPLYRLDIEFSKFIKTVIFQNKLTGENTHKLLQTPLISQTLEAPDKYFKPMFIGFQLKRGESTFSFNFLPRIKSTHDVRHRTVRDEDQVVGDPQKLRSS